MTIILQSEIICTRLRHLRDRAGLSQSGLAALVAKEVNKPDYHQTAISGIERGTRYPSVQVLAALAKILGTNTDFLLGLTDDDKPASDLEDQVVILMSVSCCKRRLNYWRACRWRNSVIW